ncbi:hypothetical protein FACS1894187_21000 [Synergistales bacterium]|nr:hypothetical protein FACS1894187_21000 [Synergistales bacterium]
MGMEYGRQRFLGGMKIKTGKKWYEWLQRHSIRACEEGGVFPDIYFRGAGDKVEISWGANQHPGMPEGFQFQEFSGASLIDRKIVTTVCKDFLKDSIELLLEKMPDSEKLKKMGLSVDELATGRVPAIDWYLPLNRVKKGTETILDVLRNKFPNIDLKGSIIPAPVLMFGTMSPELDEVDIDQILDKMEIGESSCLDQYDPGSLASVRGVPYAVGYDMADDFLDQIRDEKEGFGSDYVDIHAIVKKFGVKVKDIELGDRNVRGIALAGNGIAPMIFVNKSSSYNQDFTGRRYTVAHEFCHLLYDCQYGREVGVASGVWAPQYIEKRANAFAGMLLMPTELIDKHLNQQGDMEWDSAIFKNLMEKLQVGHIALMEHLHNLGYIDIEARTRIEDDLAL